MKQENSREFKELKMGSDQDREVNPSCRVTIERGWIHQPSDSVLLEWGDLGQGHKVLII